MNRRPPVSPSKLALSASLALCLASACGQPQEPEGHPPTDQPEEVSDETTDGSTSETAGSTSTVPPPPPGNAPGAPPGEAPSTPGVTPPTGGETPPSPQPNQPTPPEPSVPTTLPPPNPKPPNPPQGSDIKPGSGPLGVETTCNGKDDDGNGVIDDVEANGDNVCDCLRIATLGLHGEWGGGDVVTGWLEGRLEFPVESLDGQKITPERLAPYQVLLVRDVSINNNPNLSFSEAEITALWNWVRDGGGLMTVIGYSDSGERSNVNRLLEPFGLSYGSEQIVQGQGSAVPVTEWFEHPVSSSIDQVGADNGYPVVGQGITIAAQDGFDMGKAAAIGDGHVLVWGDEWITYEQEWRGSTTYQVDRFWKNALLWLTRVNECQVPPPP